MGTSEGKQELWGLLGLFYYQPKGEFDKAFETIKAMQLAAKAAGSKLQECNALLHFTGLYLDTNQVTAAIETGLQALSLADEAGKVQKTGLLHLLGMAYSKQNQFDKAADYFRQSLTICRETGLKRGEIQDLLELARIQRKEKHLPEARDTIETALKLSETMRESVAGQTRATFSAKFSDLYALYFDILMELHQAHPDQGFDVKAFEESERLRARSLVELLREARANIRQGVEPALVEREKALIQQLNDKGNALFKFKIARGREKQAAEIEDEITKLTVALEQTQTEIRQRSPRYAALTQGQSLSLAEIRAQVLDSETVLLEYAVGEEKSYLWFVTGKEFIAYELPSETALKTLVQQVNQTLLAYKKEGERATAYQTASQALSDVILKPVAGKLVGKRLLVVPDAALHYVSFAALPVANPAPIGQRRAGSVPLLARNELVVLPSASVLAFQRRDLAGRPSAEKMLAITADPVFGTNDNRVAQSAKPAPTKTEPARTGEGVAARQTPEPQTEAERELELASNQAKKSAQETAIAAAEVTIPRLVFTRQEALSITSLFPPEQTKIALDFEANRDTVLSSELSRYRMVHFATHGLLNSQHPQLSGLLFSTVRPDGTARDGFLRLVDIFNLNLPADLVVLSACQTGLGKEIKGEGLMGLSRAFLYAGANRLVVSQWNVNDQATSELMTRFYRKMLKEKLKPSEALRAAQLEMQRLPKWKAPVFWAAFQLQGEWR